MNGKTGYRFIKNVNRSLRDIRDIQNIFSIIFLKFHSKFPHLKLRDELKHFPVKIKLIT